MILDEFPEWQGQFEKFKKFLDLELDSYILAYSKYADLPLDKLILTTKQSYNNGTFTQSFWMDVREEAPVDPFPKKKDNEKIVSSLQKRILTLEKDKGCIYKICEDGLRLLDLLGKVKIREEGNEDIDTVEIVQLISDYRDLLMESYAPLLPLIQD